MSPNPARKRGMMSAITGIFSSNHGNNSNSSSSASHAPQEPASSSTPGVLRRLSTGNAHSSSNDGNNTGNPELQRSKSASQQHQQQQREAEAEVLPAYQDLLFRYQLELPDPRRLGPEAFHAGGVTANRGVSARIYAVLQRHNIISSAGGDHRVYTGRISRQLPGQLPMLRPGELHRMVGMLFWWEAEQQRWDDFLRRIDAEKERFRRQAEALAAGADVDGLDLDIDDGPPPPPLTPLMPALHGENAGSATAARPIDIGASATAPAPDSTSTPTTAPIPVPVSVSVPSGADRMNTDIARQALLERHKLAVAHLENEMRAYPSLRAALKQRRSEEGHDPTSAHGGGHGATRPPAYGDFYNSVPVMGSPSREDVSLIAGFGRDDAAEASSGVGEGPRRPEGAPGPGGTGLARDEKDAHAVAASS